MASAWLRLLFQSWRQRWIKTHVMLNVFNNKLLKLLAALPTLSPHLTAADWEALCPAGQLLANLNGCQPNCTGKESSAYNKILVATNVLWGLQPQVINFDNLPNGGSEPESLAYTTTSALLVNANGGVSQPLTLFTRPSSEGGSYFSSTNTYYVICSGFTVTNLLASPVSVAGVTATWT